MGEVGFDRKEFLYELKYWEIRSIIRGYNHRHHSSWEQARLVAYNARFCMGSKDPLPMLTEWLKFPWENVEPAISEEEQNELLEELADLNRKDNLTK